MTRYRWTGTDRNRPWELESKAALFKVDAEVRLHIYISNLVSQVNGTEEICTGPCPTHRWEQLTGPPLEAYRSNQDDIGTLYTEAPGVEIQGTEPEAERFTPYPTNSKRRYYSALQKAKDVIKDFQYKVSHDLRT